MMRLDRLSRLWLFFVVQSVCAVFFLFDAGTDWLGLEGSPGLRRMDIFEMFIALSLAGGSATSALLIRAMKRREAALQRQVDVASGAFQSVVEQQFDSWGLSASEREVAMLSIKGLSIAEIAQVRNTKEGTVKAQNAAVYRKAGVSGRMQLLSHFIEELMAEPLVERPA